MDKNIQDLFNSLAGIQQAEPAPFLYTRIKARIERKKEVTVYADYKKSVVVFALLLVLLAGNIYVMFQPQTNASAAQQTNSIDAFADAYNLSGGGYSY